MKKRFKSGYITVYLSLTTGIILSFLFTLVEGVRMNTIRFQTECVTDISLNSIFAEYNREMLKQYDLLFIDAAYGMSNPTTERTKSHLLQYMNLNYNPPGKDNIKLYKDLTAVRADNASLREISFASDGNGSVLEYQIIQYMKDINGITFLEGGDLSYEDYIKQEKKFETYQAERRNCKETIDGILEEINAEKEENEERVSIHNPADSVEELSKNSILQYALEDVDSVSVQSCNLSEYISHRGCCEGYGLTATQQITNNPISKNWYLTYIFDKCGYYKNPKENAKLNYQIEYLLKGQNSDISNLELIAEQIFKIRYVVNMAYLYSDSAKQTEAYELALAVTSSLMHPELCEVVKHSILLAWGYAESAKDLRILFDGNPLPDQKNAASWNTPLSQIASFKSHLNEYSSVGNGRYYKDYIYGFMFLNQKETSNKRLMDIMEMDIRKTTGNQYFQMDYCIYQLRAEINVSSLYGHGYQISRYYSYK